MLNAVCIYWRSNKLPAQGDDWGPPPGKSVTGAGWRVAVPVSGGKKRTAASSGAWGAASGRWRVLPGDLTSAVEGRRAAVGSPVLLAPCPANFSLAMLGFFTFTRSALAFTAKLLMLGRLLTVWPLPGFPGDWLPVLLRLAALALRRGLLGLLLPAYPVLAL